MRVTKQELIKLGFTDEHNKTLSCEVLGIELGKTYSWEIPCYIDTYLYCHKGNFKTFYFGDIRDIEFFTINIVSVEQLKDLMKSLDYSNYKKTKQ